MTLTPEDVALLGRIKGARKLAPEPANTAHLADLAARGLLKELSAGRGAAKHTVYALSPDGTKALKQALAPPKAPTKPRAPKAAPVTAADLAAMEERLLSRIDLLARALGVELAPSTKRVAPAPAPHARPAIPAEAFAAAILGAIREVDLTGRHAGLVPIPEVRRLVAARTGATREQFDLALLSLERDLEVDLKIANDPTRLDAAEGIRVQGRGLVYFALSK